jgi:hypothetical protein
MSVGRDVPSFDGAVRIGSLPLPVRAGRHIAAMHSLPMTALVTFGGYGKVTGSWEA